MQKQIRCRHLILFKNIMRISTLVGCMVMTFTMLLAATPSYSQKELEKRTSIVFKDVSLIEALEQLQRQTGVPLAYKSATLPSKPSVNYSSANKQVKVVLQDLLSPYGLTYELKDGFVVLSKVALEKSATSARIIKQDGIEVRGTVSDTTGLSLPGVSISVKGVPSTGTSTNLNGMYVLKVPTNSATLVFSLVGFRSKEVKVSRSGEFNVTLSESNEGLNEVVVVGYGTQKKISLIGAQSTIAVKDLKVPVRNLRNALVGKLAGMIGVQPSGEPGYDNSRLWIRGIATLTNADPLVLVDGVERPMNDIEPEDIDNFSILKDASATAVYGVRGANGVILINTKRGQIGKPRISASYNQGVTAFVKLPEFVDGATFMEVGNEANTTRGKAPIYTQQQIDKTRSQEDPYLFPDVNWQKEIFKDFGQNKRANLNVNGGLENVQYYVSASYFNENGMFKTGGLKDYSASITLDRVNFNSNLVLKATPSTKIDIGISGNITDGNYPGEGTSTIFGAVMQATPVIFPARYPDGKIAGYTGGQLLNPYEQLTQSGYVNNFTNRIQSNIRVTQDFNFWLPGLSFTTLFSFDAYNTHKISRGKTVDLWKAIGRDAAGDLIFPTIPERIGNEFLGYSRSNSGNRQIYTESSLNYTQKFGKHEVGAMLIYTQTDQSNAFASDFITSLPSRYHGVAGRTTYAFDNRYIAEFNFGYNGSETFAPDRRYGFFPSVGLGWIPSEEAFFNSVKEYVQLLKFRGSYGKVGNGNIGGRRFAYIATVDEDAIGYTFGKNYDNGFGGRQIGEYATDVSWEIATKMNLGVDVHTFNSSLQLQVDFFKEKREKIFLRRNSTPYYLGELLAPYGNVGRMENRGVDASANYNKKINKWYIGFKGNFTYAANKIIDDDKPSYQYPWMQTVGNRIYQHKGYIAEKLFDSYAEISNSAFQTGDNRPGDIKYKDLNGDGTIDQYDATNIGYADYPEVTYGMGFTVGYKGFELGAFFQGVANYSIYLNGEGFQPFQQGGNRGNLLSVINDRWTVENPRQDAFYPRLTYESGNMNFVKSSWWIKDASYVRLKTLEIAYNFPEKTFKRMGIKNVRLFGLGYNVMTFSSFKLWDVELGNGRGATYPNVKSYNIGLDVKF